MGIMVRLEEGGGRAVEEMEEKEGKKQQEYSHMSYCNNYKYDRLRKSD